MDSDNLVQRDLRHVWHPCSQMQDYEAFPPLPVVKAEGPYLHTANGDTLIDAISSWWCKSLGHGHPKIRAAVERQLDRFEHIIMANTSTKVLVELSEQLSELCPTLDKVFYADNGSTAMEIAMKMSLQYHAQTGQPERKKFISLENGYHGESILTLAAGDCELYTKPYAPLLPEIPKLKQLPYVSGLEPDNWDCMSNGSWNVLKKQLDPLASKLSAIIFEPILQGAGGMLIYSPDLLRRLRRWADVHGVHLIADEIMTGFGRAGKWLACEYAGITPDFVALSKGLTGGWAPMAVTLTSTKVYNAFYDDYFSGKAFLHSNTFSGYAPAAAAALAAMKIYREEGIIEQVNERSAELRDAMKFVSETTGALTNVRGVGFVIAADIVDPSTGKPFDKKLRTGYRCFKHAVKLGALLRPLGDTIYFLPPLNTPAPVIGALGEIAAMALSKTIREKRK